MSDFNPSKADQSSSNSHSTDNRIPFFFLPSSPVSSRFPKDTGDEVAFYLKSLGLERVRCVVGFVEQNVASKVKAPTRKDKDKSQRIEDGVKMKPSFFATVLSSLDGGDKPWALDLENFALKKT